VSELLEGATPRRSRSCCPTSRPTSAPSSTSILAEAGSQLWEPLPGPQTLAYESEADIIGYGGAAGGGKTDLIAGLSITKHKRVLVVRREKAQTEGFIQRMAEILGGTVGYNSQKSMWRVGTGSAPADRVRRPGQPGRRAPLAGPPARPQGLRRGHRDARVAGALHHGLDPHG
jgi:hypothetical protein